ncbi:putative membrane protein [Streptococcus sp. oral taxon 056 str. F0418]|uniref:Bax inhibitor-1/YccA family protein n=1 Tax=Streptococcus sp. oral taxon 056 TaxID=712620 RepID=UPI000218102D|nr:Bax inhibitor-1/YccA family protein [Streptococcus sp. oral taxon 056]EGP67397.1 putative membrane protein [Streptococcus sp. oral taxon 056 str. F0418]
MNNHTVIQDTAGINAFYAKIYSLVGVGLGISAVVSALMLTMFQSVIVSVIMGASWIYYLAIAAELVLVFAASGMALKNSPMALPLFLVYSALNGFTLSVVLALYTQSSVLSAFVTASAMFFAMAFVGKVTKKDLSGMGRALRAALFGLIIASVVNIFLGSGSFDFLISIAGVIIFSGLIAWDNQKIRYVYEQTNGQVENGWAISMALNLYLDFINLFLSLLRLFGRND